MDHRLATRDIVAPQVQTHPEPEAQVMGAQNSQSTSFLPVPGRVIRQWQGSLSNLPSEAAPRPDWPAHTRLRLGAPESWFSD